MQLMDGSPIDKREKNPLRFMQIHTFYDNYLQMFYALHPDIASRSHEEQINALIQDGFSAVHIFVPAMESRGYISKLIIPNCAPAQLQWLQENKVEIHDRQRAMWEIVRCQIETIKPHILYLSDSINFDSSFTRTLKWRPRLILGWRAANVPGEVDWSDFDVILSGLKGMREMALKLGAKSAEHFFPGFPEWVLPSLKLIQPKYDVVFSGQYTLEQHTKRNEYLLKVAQSSSHNANNYSCAFYLSGQINQLPPEIAHVQKGEKFGVEMFRAICSGKIALDARGDIGLIKTHGAQDLARNETVNMRLFEVTGCGVFLLTEYFDNLEQYFKIGTEIESFRNENELIDKIRYYLAHPNERNDIAQRGKERCLSDYSMSQRASVLDDIIQKYLKQSSKGIDESVRNIPNTFYREQKHSSGTLLLDDEDLIIQIDRYITNQEYKEAQTLLKDVVFRNPENGLIITTLGNVLLKLGDLESSRRELVKATTLHPNYIPAHLSLACALLFQGKYVEAESCLQHVLTNVSFPRVQFLLKILKSITP